jgi:hypothetical protein
MENNKFHLWVSYFMCYYNNIKMNGRIVMKKILIISTTRRKNGNSDILANDIVNITLHFFLKDVRSMLPPAVNHSIAVS